MLPGKMDRRHTSITGRAKAYSARAACRYSVRVPCGATSPFGQAGRGERGSSEVQMSDSPPDEARKRRDWQKIQRQLDEALDASFPASDPVPMVPSQGGEEGGRERVVPDPPAKPLSPRNPVKGVERRPHGAVSSSVEPAWFTVVSTSGRRQTRCR